MIIGSTITVRCDAPGCRRAIALFLAPGRWLEDALRDNGWHCVSPRRGRIATDRCPDHEPTEATA